MGDRLDLEKDRLYCILDKPKTMVAAFELVLVASFRLSYHQCLSDTSSQCHPSADVYMAQLIVL